VLLRGTMVIGTCAAIGLGFVGPLLGRIIDTLYRQSGSSFWHSAFYFLRQNSWSFVVIGIIAIVIITSKWIFRPYLTDYTDMCSKLIVENIHLKKDINDNTQIELPKNMKNLEDVLNKVNTEIRLSRYAAKEAEQRKDDLVVYLAHDIRTPLTSVLGYLELLMENQDLPEAQRTKFMDSALRKAKRMQSLVEELFEVTRKPITRRFTDNECFYHADPRLYG
jgi:signal transduction histidine kinase